MKSPIVRNGIWSSLLLIGLFGIPLFFTGIPGPDDFMSSEVVGHIFILICLVFIIIGMKQYREANGGSMTYWEGVKVGLLISIFPAITFGLYNLIYIFVIDPDFLTNYAEYTIQQRGAGLSGEALAEIRQEVYDEQKLFENPFIQFGVMFLSVFIMGAIVSLISAFFTKKTP